MQGSVQSIRRFGNRGTVVPRDLKCVATFHSGPRGVGDNYHATRSEHVTPEGRNFEDIQNAWNSFRLRRIKVCRLATKCRTARDHRIHHVRNAYVEAKLSAAIHLRGDIDSRSTAADEREFFLVFESYLLLIGQRQLRRGFRKFAVGRLPRGFLCTTVPFFATHSFFGTCHLSAAAVIIRSLTVAPARRNGV